MKQRVLLSVGTILLLGLVAIVIGCVNTKAVYLGAPEERGAVEPVLPDSVRIYTSVAELDTLEYIRVAMIEATGSGEWTSQTGMYSAMRKKAGKMGCNGVILPQINEPGAGAKIAGALFGTGTERKGSAVAIRVIGKKKTQPQQ